MEFEKYGLTGKKAYYIVLILGMIFSVITFNMDRELLATGIIIVAVTLLFLIKTVSERPVFDERDLSLAKDSSHTALMLTGAVGGIIMIVISIGMGLGYWGYPEWIAPFYLTWGGIVAIAVVIEISKRFVGVG